MENEETSKKIKKGINFATFELKTKLIKSIQLSELPITNIKYVLLDITNNIVALENKQIQIEQEAYAKIINENNKEKSEKNG